MSLHIKRSCRTLALMEILIFPDPSRSCRPTFSIAAPLNRPAAGGRTGCLRATKVVSSALLKCQGGNVLWFHCTLFHAIYCNCICIYVDCELFEPHFQKKHGKRRKETPSSWKGCGDAHGSHFWIIDIRDVASYEQHLSPYQ